MPRPSLEDELAIDRSSGLDPKRGRCVVKLGPELVLAGVHVEADADHGPTILGARLDQDSRQLALADQHVVRPLDQAVDGNG